MQPTFSPVRAWRERNIRSVDSSPVPAMTMLMQMSTTSRHVPIATGPASAAPATVPFANSSAKKRRHASASLFADPAYLQFARHQQRRRVATVSY